MSSTNEDIDSDGSNYPSDMNLAFEQSQNREREAYKEYSMKMEQEKKTSGIS